MDTIKLPIEYDNSGFTKITDGTDEYYKQLLSITARTEPKTHPITPQFGVFDPTFNSIDKGQFMIQAARHVPEIRLLSIETNETNQGGRDVAFTYSRRY
jgi:hypothetical protein